MSYSLQIANKLSDIPAGEWDHLLNNDQPFVSHAFLNALEQHGCLGNEVGWIPNHFILRDSAGKLVAASPAYIKTNSFGEFVFDWSWASAYEQRKMPYYPKLVSAVPFTPVTGQRLLFSPSVDLSSARIALIQGMLDFTQNQGLSGMHVLFPSESDLDPLVGNRMLSRLDFQYHWQNIGYADFEHFVSFFRSRKRKKVRRERNSVREAGITTRVLHGDQIDDELWDTLFPFYQHTFLKKNNYPALTLDFFKTISSILGWRLVVIIAEHKDQIIATAINFRDQQRLYGRYWGCQQNIDNLHFEVCFYRGIDYCIEEGLDYFEPGAQGEHKISRGFLPRETWSTHWIADEQFRVAIQNFLQREKMAMQHYRLELDNLSPFREDETS